MSSSIIWIGMDVHKDTMMVAVYLNEAREPEIVQQLPNDSRKLTEVLVHRGCRRSPRTRRFSLGCDAGTGNRRVLHILLDASPFTSAPASEVKQRECEVQLAAHNTAPPRTSSS